MSKDEDRQLNFIDILSILSFIIGLQNLELNVDQNDMDQQTREIQDKASKLVSSALSEIHQHLKMQDDKINKILEVLNEDHQKTV